MGKLKTNRIGNCRALVLIRRWMEKQDLSTGAIARKLDRTWECVDNLLSGKMRPDIDAAVWFRDNADVPIDAWTKEVG